MAFLWGDPTSRSSTGTNACKNNVVQIYAETAVLTYKLVTCYEGKESCENCTEVYQQQPDKQWKIVHSHWSLSGIL